MNLDIDLDETTLRKYNENTPSSTEIKTAIKLLKDEEAPSADNIPAELRKVDIDFIT